MPAICSEARAHACAAVKSGSEVSGRSGDAIIDELKSNAEVRSPQIARRHAEIFGSGTPSQVSRNRITEVWSKVSERHMTAAAPRRHDEHRHARSPSPIGSPRTNSPGVPDGGTGGGTWSKKPSFSS